MQILDEDDQITGATPVVLVAPSQSDDTHAMARVLNAAMDWEMARQRLGRDVMSTEVLVAQNTLRKAVRAYMPLVTT